MHLKFNSRYDKKKSDIYTHQNNGKIENILVVTLNQIQNIYNNIQHLKEMYWVKSLRNS